MLWKKTEEEIEKEFENAIENRIFNIKEIIFIHIGEFCQLQKIGNLFEIFKNGLIIAKSNLEK